MGKQEFDDLALPARDRDLIEGFVRDVRVWAPASLKSVILYGSLAKGFFPEDHDVDILLLFSTDFDHTQFYSDVYHIVRTLKPHREIHVVLKWEGEIEPAYRELIEKEGIALIP